MTTEITDNGTAAPNAPDETEFGTDKYIHRIVTEYSECIVRLSYTYVKNTADAEDVAQDVFLALIKYGKPFDSPEHERAWLIRTAINKSRNYLKSGWIRYTSSEGDSIENIRGDNCDNSEMNEVLEAVLSLPEKYRVPIHLFYYGGYTINEIAGIMRKKPATVGTLLARGREKLKALMIGGFDDE